MVRYLCILALTTCLVGCSETGWQGAQWEHRTINKAELVDNGTVVGIWLDAREYAHPSCNQIDLRADLVDNQLRITYRSLRTEEFCEMDLPISQDRGTIQIPLDEPIPEGADLVW